MEAEVKAESPFEAEVAKYLLAKGYHIQQQYEAGPYRIDIVVSYENKQIAIECDGERFHSGAAKIEEDMERQCILQRIGWKFIRIRGGMYYRDKDGTMEDVIKKLTTSGFILKILRTARTMINIIHAVCTSVLLIELNKLEMNGINKIM